MDGFFKYLSNHITLTDEEVSFIKEHLTERSYLKNQYIAQAGDVCKHYSYINTGTVRTFYVDKDGNEHIVSFGIQNWWAGDINSIINNIPAEFNIQCLEKTTVIQISNERMEIIYDAIPKMERFMRILIEKAYISSQKRVIRNHSMTAKERYVKFCESYPEFVQKIPQYMIASYLGVSKEFLSSIRSQLK